MPYLVYNQAVLSKMGAGGGERHFYVHSRTQVIRKEEGNKLCFSRLYYPRVCLPCSMQNAPPPSHFNSSLQIFVRVYQGDCLSKELALTLDHKRKKKKETLKGQSLLHVSGSVKLFPNC